ncbi:hypothetical protein JRO89_XS09G0049000 [Xanthoceras sorbifolium]|uniref:Uncharacterized protein n=1 Tax=Xanthoceras sorbifolium TaxID=99658 RepID=A0ABQ8HKQ8_9ROSI|nr:hypothetical protein JRO89_XS09G0049000 [Xanthoceras sorbifolium]
MFDVVAQAVGLPFPSPCLGLSKEEQKTLRTGVDSGTCLRFDNQIDLFETTMKNLQPSFDSPESMANYLSKSLFFLSIGSVDVNMGYDILDNITNNKLLFQTSLKLYPKSSPLRYM